MPNKPTLVVTNPLHYVYFRQQYELPAIGSTHGIFAQYAERLGFTQQATFYDVANTLPTLITANNDVSAAYITWKPAATNTVLGNDYDMATNLERKSVIREVLPTDLFPRYIVLNSEDEIKRSTYADLSSRLASIELVVQIDQSTGGKGTYFIADKDQFEAVLPVLIASQQPIIVSERVLGESRGLQCLLLDRKVYSTGWWHRDLVAIDGVANLQVADATRYCGAILETIPQLNQSNVEQLIHQVTANLNDLNYSGIFGIDIVTLPDGRLKLIEVNTRFTAVSHLYATAMHAVGYDTDFLTLHVMDLVGIKLLPETIAALRLKHDLPNQYFYLKLQNNSLEPMVVNNLCNLGVYDECTYQRFGWGIDALRTNKELVIIPEAAQGIRRLPGERVFSVIGSGDPLQNGQLSTQSLNLLTNLRHEFLSPEL